MRSKWSRRIRWFLDCFTPGYTIYTKSGGEVRIYPDGGFTSRPPDWKKIMDKHLAERARLDALWRAEQEAAKKAQAGETSQR